MGPFKVRNLVAIAFLIVSQVPATATEAIITSSMSTAALMDGCRRAGDTLRADCAGYIIGVFDEMSSSRLICPPTRQGGRNGKRASIPTMVGGQGVTTIPG